MIIFNKFYYLNMITVDETFPKNFTSYFFVLNVKIIMSGSRNQKICKCYIF